METDNTVLKYLPYGYYKQFTEVDGATVLKGYAAANTLNSDAKWFITKNVNTTNLTKELYAESYANDIKWDDRDTETYK